MEVEKDKMMQKNSSSHWNVKKLTHKGTDVSRANIGRCDSMKLLDLLFILQLLQKEWEGK